MRRRTVENAIALSGTKECDRFNQKADDIIPVDCMIFQLKINVVQR
ncbi:hypothetical protein [Nostoc sp. TCL240-02]|nr:hypothetical protein [Nostoc sp. TCL240-02]